jgi:hypothetical protein
MFTGRRIVPQSAGKGVGRVCSSPCRKNNFAEMRPQVGEIAKS